MTEVWPVVCLPYNAAATAPAMVMPPMLSPYPAAGIPADLSESVCVTSSALPERAQNAVTSCAPESRSGPSLPNPLPAT